MSKGHPGMSESYKYKMEMRAKRAPARALLQNAKKLLLLLNPQFNFKANRYVVFRVKKLIKKY